MEGESGSQKPLDPPAMTPAPIGPSPWARLRQRLKARRWRRLGAEFVVVFAGVTLSLLADDWREARSRRAAETGALRLIVADLEADSLQLAELVAPLPGQDSAAEWFTRNWRTSPAVEATQRALRTFQAAAQYNPKRSSFVGLREGPGIGIIRNDSIRNGIVLYFEQTQADVQQWVAFHWSEREALWDVLWPHLRMPPGRLAGAMLPSADVPPILVTPWSALSQDLRVYNQVGQVGVAANVAAKSIRAALASNALLKLWIAGDTSM